MLQEEMRQTQASKTVLDGGASEQVAGVFRLRIP